jgi:hypothetical protein
MRGNTTVTINNQACLGWKACRKLEGEVMQGSCIGPQACLKLRGRVLKNSCFGPGACNSTGFDSKIGESSCNGKVSIPYIYLAVFPRKRFNANLNSLFSTLVRETKLELEIVRATLTTPAKIVQPPLLQLQNPALQR